MTYDRIPEACRWLATTPESARPHPIIPHLRQVFGLSAKEACQAIREAGGLSPSGDISDAVADLPAIAGG